MRTLPLALLAVGVSSLPAQEKPVPVVDEPMHRTLFENAQVRVIDVRIPPGETSLYHIHVLPSVIIYLTRSTNRSENWPDKAILTRDIAPGQSRYAPYDEKPLTHRVTNTGTGLFRVLDIELLQKTPVVPAVPPAPVAGATVHWNEKLVRSSGLTLAPGTTRGLYSLKWSHLVVAITGPLEVRLGGWPGRTLQVGDFEYVPAGASFELINSGNKDAELVLLELKTG